MVNIPNPIKYPSTISYLFIGVAKSLSKVPVVRSLKKLTPDIKNTKKNINNPIKIIDYNTNAPSFIWDGILKNIEECEYPEYYRITIKEERECDNNA